MLGRPLLYAIGADGARGLATMIDLLRDEVSVTLAQLGVCNVEDIDDAGVLHTGGWVKEFIDE